MYMLVQLSKLSTPSIVVTCFCHICNMDLSKFLHGFVKVFYMDLAKLLHGFVKVVLCISHNLPNKTKLMILKLIDWLKALNKV